MRQDVFTLNVAGVNIEMHLVAEGYRKLAMIAPTNCNWGAGLIKDFFSGTNQKQIYQSQDHQTNCENNLYMFCQSGIQVFIASHSLFLLRELDILLKKDEFRGTPARFWFASV